LRPYVRPERDSARRQSAVGVGFAGLRDGTAAFDRRFRWKLRPLPLESIVASTGNCDCFHCIRSSLPLETTALPPTSTARCTPCRPFSQALPGRREGYVCWFDPKALTLSPLVVTFRPRDRSVRPPRLRVSFPSPSFLLGS